MEYITVRGTRVPALGLGTWRLTGGEAERVVAAALDMGYRHIDTAQAYENEAEVGRALQAAGVERAEVFLTTKQRLDRLGEGEVREGAEASLRRLRTDYVDLLLIHWPPATVPVEEPLDQLRQLQSEGKILHGGVSNFTPSLARRSVEAYPVFCQQIEYHPFLDQSEQVELARENGYMLTAYCPLARGRAVEEPALVEIGERHEKTPSQVTLRWLLDKEIVAAIPKASSREHLRENLGVFDFELSDDERERIDGLAREERLVDPDFAPRWRT
jgi:2,5-diketo-D-gluconate reductase B